MEETDLSELRNHCITSLYLCAENVIKYLDNEKEVELDNLKQCVKQYCTLEAEQIVATEAKEKAKTETDSANIHTLDNRYQSYLKSLAGKRLRADNHPYMLEYIKRCKKAMQNKKPANVDDSDLAINEAETQEQYIDPISKRPITDPVRNTLCSHVYEKKTIMELIQHKRMRCPVAGCGNGNQIIPSHLISDDELKFRMSIPVCSTMIQERSIMDLDDTM